MSKFCGDKIFFLNLWGNKPLWGIKIIWRVIFITVSLFCFFRNSQTPRKVNSFFQEVLEEMWMHQDIVTCQYPQTYSKITHMWRGGVHHRISVEHLLMNLENNFLFKKLLKLASKKYEHSLQRVFILPFQIPSHTTTTTTTSFISVYLVEGLVIVPGLTEVGRCCYSWTKLCCMASGK